MNLLYYLFILTYYFESDYTDLFYGSSFHPPSKNPPSACSPSLSFKKFITLRASTYNQSKLYEHIYC